MANLIKITILKINFSLFKYPNDTYFPNMPYKTKGFVFALDISQSYSFVVADRKNLLFVINLPFPDHWV